MSAGDADILVTLGRCDDMRAEVYVRGLTPSGGGTSIEGTISGPWRIRDTTLPVRTRLMPLVSGPLEAGIARAVLTEPAYWTPDLPSRYRIEARLLSAAEGPADVEMMVGLRRLGVRGRSLWLDGRRWVPRAVAGSIDLADAREVGLGVVSVATRDDLLRDADALGVAMVPRLSAADTTPPVIAALSRHPSASLAIIEEAEDSVEVGVRVHAVRPAKGTLLLGLAVDGTRPPCGVPEGVDALVLVLPMGSVPHDAWRELPGRPLLAWRKDVVRTAVEARAACDRLQRDLAAWGMAGGADRVPWDWAGYLVGAG